MTKIELIKELEKLADSCDSKYALEINGYNRGVLDSILLINKFFELSDGGIENKKLFDILRYSMSEIYSDNALKKIVKGFIEHNKNFKSKNHDKRRSNKRNEKR